MENQPVTRTAVEICSPCFQAVSTFDTTDWILVGLLGVLTVIFAFTKKNFFWLAGALARGVSSAKKENQN